MFSKERILIIIFYYQRNVGIGQAKFQVSSPELKGKMRLDYKKRSVKHNRMIILQPRTTMIVFG